VHGVKAPGSRGHFKRSSSITLGVLRQHKETLLAMLEAFALDPLLTWQAKEVDNPTGKLILFFPMYLNLDTRETDQLQPCALQPTTRTMRNATNRNRNRSRPLLLPHPTRSKPNVARKRKRPKSSSTLEAVSSPPDLLRGLNLPIFVGWAGYRKRKRLEVRRMWT
jgi:hypothetical protein